MEIYADTVSIIVENFWRDHIGADDDKYNEMQEYYDRVVREKLKPRDRNTHLALLYCKSFDEIAERSTIVEKKKKPLKPDSIRKRRDRILRIITKFMKERYGE